MWQVGEREEKKNSVCWGNSQFPPNHSMNIFWFVLESALCQVLGLVLQVDYKTGRGSCPPELAGGDKVTNVGWVAGAWGTEAGARRGDRPLRRRIPAVEKSALRSEGHPRSGRCVGEEGGHVNIPGNRAVGVKT